MGLERLGFSLGVVDVFMEMIERLFLFLRKIVFKVFIIVSSLKKVFKVMRLVEVIGEVRDRRELVLGVGGLGGRNL